MTNTGSTGRVLTVRNPDPNPTHLATASVAESYRADTSRESSNSTEQNERCALDVTFDNFVASDQLLSLAELEKLEDEQMAGHLDVQVNYKAQGLFGDIAKKSKQALGKGDPPALKRLEGSARFELD
jgi:hypothetical protein